MKILILNDRQDFPLFSIYKINFVTFDWNHYQYGRKNIIVIHNTKFFFFCIEYSFIMISLRGISVMYWFYIHFSIRKIVLIKLICFFLLKWNISYFLNSIFADQITAYQYSFFFILKLGMYDIRHETAFKRINLLLSRGIMGGQLVGKF